MLTENYGDKVYDYNLVNTDQPPKKALFSRFAAEHPLREIFFFSRRKRKITYFAEGFLREISRGHKTNSKSLRPQYNHRMCGHRGGTMYM